MIVLSVGCVAKKEKMVHHTKNKKVLKYQSGVPSKLQGIYYRVDISDLSTGNDIFTKLTVSKKDIHKLAVNDSLEHNDWKDVSYRKINDNTYIFKVDYRYIKLISLSEKKLMLSKETLFDDKDACNDKELQTYSNEKPIGNFGVSPNNLFRKIYTSNLEVGRYIKFNDSPIGTILLRTDDQGNQQFVEHFEILTAKTNGYILSKSFSDDREILDPVTGNQLKNIKTGEIFTFYPHDEETLNQEIRQKLGLPPVVYKNPIKNDYKTKKEDYPKTYDFADDKDDDYYDTYDDFGLNDGD